MKDIIQPWLTILLFAIAFPTHVNANQQPNSRTVKFRAICFQHVGGIKQVHAVMPERESVPISIDLYTTTFSDEVELQIVGDQIHFALMDSDDGNLQHGKVFESARAASGSRQLAIFVPGSSDEKPYQVFVVDDSLENFPMGSTLAINLAAIPFQFNIGEHTVAVAPKRIGKIPMARQTNDRGQVSVIISIADPNDGVKWRPVNQTRWLTGDDKRDLVISFMHPVTHKPTVHAYTDMPGISP